MSVTSSKLLSAILLISVFASSSATAAEPPVKAELVSVAKIWDKAPHNAFTDLVRFNDQWYCAFREGERHVGDVGKLRVIRSADGGAWESTGLLEMDDFDLRDACLSIMPDGRLMLLGGARQMAGDSHPTGTVVSMSSDGAEWSAPKLVLDPGHWLWRVTWHDGAAYGIAYTTGKGFDYSLQETRDGLHYAEIPLENHPPSDSRLTEARLRFDDDGACYCLQRRDGDPRSALLGKSAPPYRQWTWRDLGAYFGGPNFIQTPKGHWIGAGRMIDPQARTHVTWLDVENAQNLSILELPSGGDCSYPGMVWHDDLLWVSYYSSHEGRTSIYLAKVRITPK